MLTSGEDISNSNFEILFCRDGAEFECIYAAYCYEVNQQAKLGGMASSVAKINSVGLRLALKVFNFSIILILILYSSFKGAAHRGHRACPRPVSPLVDRLALPAALPHLRPHCWHQGRAQLENQGGAQQKSFNSSALL